MPEHFTPELVEAYRARTLAPDDLVAAASHLASCPQCRAKVAPAREQGKLLEALSGEHLQYEALEALAQGGRAGLRHIADCRQCAEELKDLRSFQESLRRGDTPWPGIRLLIPLTAVSVLALTMTLFHPSPSIRKPTSSAVMEAALRDGNRIISLDRQGSLRGIESAPAEERAQIAEALHSGKLPASPVDTDLVRSRETLLGEPALGEPAAPASVRPLTPVGTMVGSDRPVFRWIGPAGATDFRVAVYDSAFELVQAGKALNPSEWTPARPLPRGKTYTWTVSALLNGSRVTAPHAPEPEAKFRVAAAENARLIEALSHSTPASSLRLAVAASRLGFHDEARSALDRLERENTGSPLVESLRESLTPPKK